ncbi:histidine kinase [Bacillus cereus]|uniref:histidine kinase n=1 Tax=Bacillus cereus TaxID=1396 RepID=UPI0024BE291B|nr:histidine kinase [Bacillus cereus]
MFNTLRGRELKVKNKGKVVLFLLVAGEVFLVKPVFKFGTIHMIQTWFESVFS